MRITIFIAIGMFLNVLSWCSQVAIGIDSDKLVVLEYWKYNDNELTNKVLLYNPTDKAINVKIKKWHRKKQSFFEKLISRNTILRYKRIKPNEYKVIRLSNREAIRKHKGIIQFFVNGKSAGLYSFWSKREKPKNKIHEGIIINRAANTGGKLEYEIIFSQLKNLPQEKIIAEIKYINPNFHHSCFHKGEKYNPHKINVQIEESENLKWKATEISDIEIKSTGDLGSVKIAFSNFNSDRRILQRNFSHMIKEGTGRTIAFYVPRKIEF